MRRQVACAVIGVCVVLLAGCATAPAPADPIVEVGTPAPAQAASSTPAPAQPSATVTATPAPPTCQPTEGPLAACVNGTPISAAALGRELERRAGTSGVDRNVLRQLVLDEMIRQVMVEQYAARQGVSVSEARLADEIAAYVALAGGADGWQGWLALNGYTEDEFRAALRANLVFSGVRDQVVARLDGDVPQVRARHILLRTEAEALAVLADLQVGEDFSALAAQSADVTTRDLGGDLGWFTREELLEPALAEVAFQLQPGQVAGPVPTRLGYHVIQTLETANRPLDDAKRALAAQALFETWLEALVRGAVVQRAA